jgi:hypothetical protein
VTTGDFDPIDQFDAPAEPAARRPGRPSRRTFRRIPVVILVVGLVLAAIVFERSRDDDATASPGVVAANPTMSGADDVSAAWFCAEGTAQPDGRANETVVVANVGTDDSRATITVLPSADGQEPEARTITVEAGEQVRVPVLDIAEVPEQADSSGILRGPGVVVEAFGGRVLVEHVIEGQDDFAVGPCTREAGRRWYFAAGTTVRGAEQYLSLLNPFQGDAIVDVQFVTEEGVQNRVDLQALVVPRRSRITIPVQAFERRRERVATLVSVRTGRIVAEQSNAFTTENEIEHGLSLSLGAPARSRVWMLPSVVGGPGANQAVQVANFSTIATDVEVSVHGAPDVVDPETVPVPGRSVVTVDLGNRVTSELPATVVLRSSGRTSVVAEQSAFFDASTPAPGVEATLATSTPARGWAFALGRLDPESLTSLVVYNPGRTPTTIRLLTTVGDRRDVASEEEVEGGDVVVLDLNELGIDPEQAMEVDAGDAVVVGRIIDGPAGRSVSLGIVDEPGAR